MAGFWLFALDRNLRLTTLACFEHLVFVDSLISFTIRWAGQALFGTLTPDIIVLTLLYSIAGLGIAIVNDFKSVEGDRALGLQSLPVAFGEETAKWICVGAIDITQLSIAGYLLRAGKPYYALAILALIVPQVVFQYFLKDPVKYDAKYQASAQLFLVLGLLVTALATSH
ncbi:chlorophyll synthase, chloroplastic-like isoform X3 [Vicia villosa]|uniref:chlorophyll synthase, chloroplastic-like isoform X3 n=1 Tax=Vicia villosa TaxID=3911 RepID=UPI00273AAAF0|nr:chlorophyll synthase, chloroplastic-like isoform X3 [Vicia villosa]